MGTAYSDQSISEAPTTVHPHIPPRPRTIQETGKPVAAILRTGFTIGGWKSVGGLAPPAHCNLNSTLLHILNIKQIGPELQLLLLMTHESLSKRRKTMKEVKFLTISPGGLVWGRRMRCKISSRYRVDQIHYLLH